MPMHTRIKERRTQLGFTQEQVAKSLGVTAPAVNKWEKGTNCPDIALLPALARLLKTDPNTLLDFQENLSPQEVARFQNEVALRIRAEGYEPGFRLAMEQLQEYPNCMALFHAHALLLDGALLMSDLTDAQKQPYEEEILSLYERVAKSGDPSVADNAKYMLASKRLQRKQLEAAQEMLDLLPEWSALDKRGMQANLWNERGERAKAAELLERKLTMSVQDTQATLCSLIRFAAEVGDNPAALALADCAKSMCEAFRLSAYWANIAPMEAAIATKDTAGGIAALKKMLRASDEPLDVGFSPLFTHIPRPESAKKLPVSLIKPLLTALEQSPEYAFLRDAPEFEPLMETYRGICDKREREETQTHPA